MGWNNAPSGERVYPLRICLFFYVPGDVLQKCSNVILGFAVCYKFAAGRTSVKIKKVDFMNANQRV